MEINPVVLNGRYVRLEPMNEVHVTGLTAIGLDESIWEHLMYGEMKSEDDIRRWVKDILSRPDLPLCSGSFGFGGSCWSNSLSEY